MNNDENYGNIRISDDVLAKYARDAVRETEGVADLSAGFTDALSKNLLGKTNIYKGIRIVQEEQEVQIDIHLIIKIGINIPEAAWNVQEKVKKRIESLTGIKVKAVNIFVEGVSSEDEQ